MKRLFNKFNRPLNWASLFLTVFLFYVLWVEYIKSIRIDTRKPINYDKPKLDTVTFDDGHTEVFKLDSAD